MPITKRVQFVDTLLREDGTILKFLTYGYSFAKKIPILISQIDMALSM